ncbi:LysR family transcriptional regulator [Paracoccus tegillarcae]|uniref:LysR family transcriptional regulator n=1 Tax=Paracoccus tegillarcae TaxID=1529068 RepID=A0A2K9ETV1_9RHOB|nr:LysR family transcriptional regulator [Paracoccus tegillarcae]AUH32644.1 LysR family transcriptional regulator [Paracoccus tegillarcae]
MTFTNLRHLRVLLAVEDTGSLTLAAGCCNVSQPAVTQSLAKLETLAGGPLYLRSNKGVFITERGQLLVRRVRRAFALLDQGLEGVSPRAGQIVSFSQLTALIAVCDAENFTLAARRLGRAQPTVHRAVTQLEQEAGRDLFNRTPYGVVPTRSCQVVARAALLAFAELDQARAELAELDGREAGRIVIGALPLARSVMLPQALTRFRRRRPRLPVIVNDGPYKDMLGALRRGQIDVIVGALRDPAPVDDIVQEPLFEDRLLVLAAPDHPMADERSIDPALIADSQWVVPRAGSPARAQFDIFFATATGRDSPASMIEAGSILLMRELLRSGDFLGCISGWQAEAEITKGLLVPLEIEWDFPGRPIGLTHRLDWRPTAAQAELLQELRDAATGAKAIPGSGRPQSRTARS